MGADVQETVPRFVVAVKALWVGTSPDLGG